MAVLEDALWFHFVMQGEVQKFIDFSHNINF